MENSKDLTNKHNRKCKSNNSFMRDEFPELKNVSEALFQTFTTTLLFEKCILKVEVPCFSTAYFGKQSLK